MGHGSKEGVTWFSQKGAATKNDERSCGANIAPNLPQYLGPGNAVILISRIVTFTWQDGGDSDNQPRNYRTFSLQVATNSGFTNLVTGIGRMWQSGAEYADTSWTTTLPTDGVYYWRLYAYDGALGSGWSGARRLTVNTAPPAAPTGVLASDGVYANRSLRRGTLHRWRQVMRCGGTRATIQVRPPR